MRGILFVESGLSGGGWEAENCCGEESAKAGDRIGT
jgi:hypothetical protein